MTSVRTWLLAACLLLATGAEASSLLRDLRHAVSRDRTRLTLDLTGPLSYTVREEDGRLLLRFAGLRLAEGIAGGRAYRSGLIERVQFALSHPDTVAMMLTFRSGATYRILRPEAGGTLEIDAEGPPYLPPPVVRTSRSVPERKAKKEESKKDEMKFVKMGRLIDIAALAMEQAKRPEAPPPPVPPAKTQKPAEVQPKLLRPSQAGASALGWVLAVIISVSTTGITLLLVGRRSRKKSLAAPVSAEEAPPSSEGLFSRDLLEAMAGPEEDPEQDEEIGQETEGATWFAERFQRGAEEVDLAFRLRGVGAAEAKAKIARELGSKAVPASRLAQSARRGGVGIGEMELARNLRNLASAQRRKEKTP